MVTELFKFRKRTFNVAPYKDSWHEFEAFAEDRLAGRVICFEAPPGSGDCWIHDLWVSPSSRKSGLGSELLRLAIETAQAHQCVRLLGEFRAYDTLAEAELEPFFQGNGFSVEEDWDGSGRAVVLRMMA